MAALRHKIRNKLIVLTVLPVLAVYSILFWFGRSHVEDYVSADAQRWLREHARHQASRLALVMSQVPKLADGLADLVIAEPDQHKALLYAHLIDGLRRAPIVRAVGVQYGTPPRGATMRRGETIDLTMDDHEPPRTWHGPGWHRVDDALLFERPILLYGIEIGSAWVELAIADIYAETGRQHSGSAMLLVTDDDGRLLPPAAADAAVTELADRLPPQIPLDRVVTAEATAGAAPGYWLVATPLVGLPWQIVAAMPADTTLAAVEKETARVGVALLISLLTIVVIIGLAARRIARPLTALDASVREIAHGNLAVAPEVMSNDEVGELARAIQRMARQIADREQQLRAAQQVLEQRVSERTAELQQTNARLVRQIAENRETQEALRLANDQAQQANRAKSEFLSNMSHELRTPLHGVLGYAQILRRDTPPGSSQRESLEAIERCGQHLLTLINDILDMAKIEAGRMLPDLQPGNLSELIEDVRMIVAQRAAAKGLELIVEQAPDVPVWILTDGLKLKQILLNLLGNAVKFTQQGTVRLIVGQADRYLEFEVIDTGIGIPGDKLEAVFEAFQQVRDGQAVDGTGLGLAINQRLIALLGGEALRVDSSPGFGSRFRFRIPCQPLDPMQDSPAGMVEAVAAPRLTHGRRCAVLVLDNAAGDRETVADPLRRAGCDVESFGSPDDALRRLQESPFDLVVADMRLADGKAADLANSLRNQAASGTPRLLAVGGSAYPEAAKAARDAGFDAFLPMPFRDDRLQAVLTDQLGLQFERPLAETPQAPTGRPQPGWPAELAAETARRIEAAVDLGDVGSLFALAEELASNPSAAQTDVETLALMTRLFDFEGLRTLARRLRQALGAEGSAA